MKTLESFWDITGWYVSPSRIQYENEIDHYNLVIPVSHNQLYRIERDHRAPYSDRCRYGFTYNWPVNGEPIYEYHTRDHTNDTIIQDNYQSLDKNFIVMYLGFAGHANMDFEVVKGTNVRVTNLSVGGVIFDGSMLDKIEFNNVECNRVFYNGSLVHE